MRQRPTLLLLALVAAGSPAHAQRREVDLDADWRFARGDVSGAEAPAFDDGAWRRLELPHDWAFEAPYDPHAAQTDRGGYKPGGIGWYRREIEVPAAWHDRRVTVGFDAVFMNSRVWINGTRLGERPYGYISFAYDLTAHLHPGRNVLAVRVDSAREPAARWYHGCGITGHVRLTVTAPLHVARDGVYVTTPRIDAAAARVSVQTTVVNAAKAPGAARLVSRVLSPEGEPVAEASQDLTVGPGATRTVAQILSVPQPQRWDTQHPRRYTLVSRIERAGQDTDAVATGFGIRSLRWDRDTGFWLNGEAVKLRGVCDHLEAGPVGAAVPDELLRWKLERLRAMGCNAVRTAHNPQVPAFYDLCDELGLLVVDEIFDGWTRKAAQDYGAQAFDAWWERDLRDWLRRDRNHPSVILWSLGNETRGAVARDLVAVCHELDPSRLTTSGHSGSEVMDVLGVNGSSEKMGFFRQRPTRPFVSTEAPHTWQVRGFYRTRTWYRDGYPNPKQQPFPCPDLTEREVFTYDWAPPGGSRKRKQHFNSSYDNAMVRITARKSWELVRDLPWYSGQFRWTGFDYLGEAGYVHGGWPFRAFMGGALDLAGFEKDLFYFYQSQWTEAPRVHILPHWTHPRMAPGTAIPVWVYTNCDRVELYLNGHSLGTDHPGRAWDQMQCEWRVPWEPGRLEAVGYRAGREVARVAQVTAGAPARLRLSRQGRTCPILTVGEVDTRGVLNPYAENRIHYRLEGPARILSLESGNPVNTESNVGTTSRAAFFGRARAFLKVTAPAGPIHVTVGAICGDVSLFTSRRIQIDIQTLALRGPLPRRDLRVTYSLDGSEPTPDSPPYSGPFDLPGPAVVHAAVYEGNTRLLRLAETFGPDQGLYWPPAAAASESRP